MADAWEQAKQLSRRISDTSAQSTWDREQHGMGEIPPWQRRVISMLIALAAGSEIRFLDASVEAEQASPTFVALTDERLIWVQASRDSNPAAFEAITIALSELRVLRLLSVEDVHAGTTDFPMRLEVTLEFEGREVVLPVSKSPSQTVYKELASVYPALLPR
ncbi:hypothetical protein ACFRFH_09530 [Leifsonia sp. NPDC056824]|uniref:hypothetical protein n=1 Tax=Leifsonia sp. NPDC056824 TaxID=3345953 RepID=UPI0036C51C42